MRIMHVIGTRPNFVKMAPVIAALERADPDGSHSIVHTGQHYDRMMSGIFLEELGVREPDHMLGVGSGSHAAQIAGVMAALAKVVDRQRPELIVVPGDVNSTLAASLLAADRRIAIAHVESGLRSFDRSMPEEVNRVLTDQLSRLLYTHSEEAEENLVAEGIGAERIIFVGNTMIDTLVALEERFRAQQTAAGLGFEAGSYLLVTLHRPALVDGPLLGATIDRLAEVASSVPVLFPVHPRTRKELDGAADSIAGLTLIDPIGYLDFLSLIADAGAVLTDSGGIQEETTYLGVRCFTLRDNTERPVTVRLGTNTLLGLDPSRIAEIPGLIEAGPSGARRPPLWDGLAAERIASDVLGRQAP